MSKDFCNKPLKSRSKFSPKDLHRCHCHKGHDGDCDEFPYLNHLAEVAPKVADKIIRDSIMTTGAAWKSDIAGPNRIRRWAMLLSDADLLKIGINMSKLSPIIVAKLREKAAQYGDCMAVARTLTALVYGMENAPEAPKEIKAYLEDAVGPIVPKSTKCTVCLKPLDYKLFDEARRGKAAIETAHLNPRLHTAGNVGFAHRTCNIAQGNKTAIEFYIWIAEILERAGYKITPP